MIPEVPETIGDEYARTWGATVGPAYYLIDVTVHPLGCYVPPVWLKFTFLARNGDTMLTVKNFREATVHPIAERQIELRTIEIRPTDRDGFMVAALNQVGST